MSRTSSDDRHRAVEQRLRERFLHGLAGDQIEYEAFLRELSGHLRGYLRKRLSGLPDEIEDLVQETLIAVHSRRDTYDAGQPLTAWVYAIARYKIVDLLRSWGPRARASEVFDEESDVFGAVDNEAALARRDDIGDDRLRKRQQPAAAEPLECARDDQPHHRGCKRTPDRADGEQRDGHQEHRPPAVDVAELPVERSHRGRRHQIGGHHPRQALDIGEFAPDRRQGRRNDRLVKRAEKHGEHDSENDLADSRRIQRRVVAACIGRNSHQERSRPSERGC